jgi:hypothetical protein
MKFKNYTRFAVIVVVGSLIFAGCKQRPGAKTDSDTPKQDSSQATTKGGEYTDTSSSSVRVFDQNGRVCVQQSNTFYELVDLYKGATKIPMMLKINRTDLCFADSVNKDRVYQITAKSLLDNEDIHWETKFVATDMQVKDNTLYVTHEGGDNEEDYITRYSLTDGKEVFACSYGDLKVSIPNVRDKRFIGYTSQAAVGAPVQKQHIENLFGVIKYSSTNGLISKANLKLKRSKAALKMPLYTPEIILVSDNTNTSTIEDGKSLILMKADENYKPGDVKEFSVQLTFYFGDDNESTKVIIPVVNDKLDVAHAQFDKGLFSVEE